MTAGAGISVVVLVSLLALHGNTRKLFCGFVAAIFYIMYGSPLSIMRLVIRTESVEFMPFFLALFVILCGTSWFTYGLLGHDPFVVVCNGVGAALGADYGGGIVSGDHISCKCCVGDSCTMVLTTQGPTKVYKPVGSKCSQQILE